MRDVINMISFSTLNPFKYEIHPVEYFTKKKEERERKKKKKNNVDIYLFRKSPIGVLVVSWFRPWPADVDTCK